MSFGERAVNVQESTDAHVGRFEGKAIGVSDRLLPLKLDALWMNQFTVRHHCPKGLAGSGSELVVIADNPFQAGNEIR